MSYSIFCYLDSPNHSSEPEDTPSVESVEIELFDEFEGSLENNRHPPTDVFHEHHDYDLFLLNQEIDTPSDKLNSQNTHVCENLDDILIHATNLSHTFALPQFMAQHNYEDLDPTDNPSTVPPALQDSSDHPFNPRCAHTPMATQCNQSQYPNPNHNFILLQFMAQHNCEELKPTGAPSTVPTALQAFSDHTLNPKCAHDQMATQCNQSQYITLMKQNCAHNPSASQVSQTNLSNSLTFPYPQDPGEHVLKRSATATGEQDSPVKWFKIMCTSSKRRMPDTSILTDVYVAYSPIDFMNHKWTNNLHDGYPSLNVLLPVEYIPPSILTLCNLKYTMFHFGVDSHSFTKEPQHDFTGLASPKREIESPFSWNSFLRSPRSSILCFGEPTLAKLNHEPTLAKLNQEPTLAKLNQVKLLCETESYITKSSYIWYTQQHIGAAHQIFIFHSNLVTTPSSSIDFPISFSQEPNATCWQEWGAFLWGELA